MQFYLKTVGGTHCLFTILNFDGHPVFEVSGKITPFVCRMLLFNEEHGVVGRISGVRISNSTRYSVVAGGQRIRVTVNDSSFRRPVRILGKRWRFRGSLLVRSFDIVNEISQVVMTHGKCWGTAGDCYAVEIANPENVPLCLCIAALLDCTASGGCPAPILAGG